MFDKNKLMSVKLPAMEMQLAYVCYNNLKESKELNDMQKFIFMFTYFYSLGKFNTDAIEPEMKEIIEHGVDLWKKGAFGNLDLGETE